ncbi:MAG TPA: HEAT repeat domain-containing protein [Gemmatimonadaceae bacterium]|nr:HEAT repeat domain-containing protein [Gemmatimonadaceae bacterium]
MTLPTLTPAGGDAGAEQEPPFPPGPVEELLRLLVKAGRAHQLYLPNNPIYRGAIDALRAAFPPIWERTDELTLRFSDSDIKWFGRPVLTETAKSSDSISWTFFKDGIREITLAKDFETEELTKFLDILQRVRKSAGDDDDLLTMLWEADFANLRYRYVDLGTEPAAALESGEDAKPRSPDEVRGAMHEESESARSGVVNMQDFDATLYFLDEKELDYLRREIEREYNSDLRRTVISTLLDIYEAQAAPNVREEVSELIETLMLALLAAAQFRAVAFLLAEARVAVERGQNVTPEQRERVGKLADRLSTDEPMGQLLQGLDQAADLPDQEELTELFQQLRPGALGPIFAWLPKLQNARIKPLVEEAATRLASANTAALVALIQSTDQVVSLEAIRRSGALKSASAVLPLAKVLADSKDVQVRQAAVNALMDIGSAGALQALEKSVEDADRDVRIAAVRTLGAKAYKGALTRLDNVVKGKALRSADRTEKMAFFEAYGCVCGDGGVPFLDEMLNGKGLFGKREDAEMRACAAVALGRVNTEKSRASLQKAADEKDVVVRSAVNKALRGERATGVFKALS